MRSKRSVASKPEGYKRVLTFEAYKTGKSKDFGYLTGILYMSPAKEAGIMVNGHIVTMCPKATPECEALCLKSSGRMGMTNAVKARIWRTKLYFDNPELFFACLAYDIETLKRKADRLGLTPCFRANGTTDFPKIADALRAMFPDDIWYDYTKLDRPWERVASNYSLTFSYSGHNLAECMQALQHGVNVAVVFDTRKGQALPSSWQGYEVIDGDTHDLRFLDKQFGKTVIVGLRAKGVAKSAKNSAFVVAAASSAFPMLAA